GQVQAKSTRNTCRLHFLLYRLKAAARLWAPFFDAITCSSLERRSSNAVLIASSRSWLAFNSAACRRIEAFISAICAACFSSSLSSIEVSTTLDDPHPSLPSLSINTLQCVFPTFSL